MELPLDHVAIAVEDLHGAVATYEALTGGTATPVERVEAQDVEVTFIGSGTGRIELVAPTSERSPVARFLARRGSGLHHLAYRVHDLTERLRELAARGVELIDHEPRPGAHGRRVAFLHPRSTGGVLIELIEE